MSFPIESLPDNSADLVDAVKDFVRIDHDLDDQAVLDFIFSATKLCENFIGQSLFLREELEMLSTRAEWQKLKRIPVQSIIDVESVASDGTSTMLSAGEYAIDIDSDGFGWIRLQQTRSVSRVRVRYEAGIASAWDHIPSNITQGIVRMVGYLYAHRDGNDAGGPPNAVTALWRPHRRLRIR